MERLFTGLERRNGNVRRRTSRASRHCPAADRLVKASDAGLLAGMAGILCMAGLLIYALTDHWWRMAKQSFELTALLKHHGQDKRMASAETVYHIFRDTPDEGRTSYLHDHYRRGLQGLLKPQPTQTYALAAWRAGRDTAAETRSDD